MSPEFENLELIKSLQKTAYQACAEVQESLFIGITEKEAASLLKENLKQKGIHHYFHRPFAWFGDRTGFKDFSKPFDIKNLKVPNLKNPLPHFGKEFLPSQKKLANNMPVILDVAPTEKGFAVDIGYSFMVGESEEHQAALEYLKVLRKKIIELVKEDCTIKELYLEIEKDLTENQYKNCHGLYPLGVLGHRIGRLPKSFLPNLSIMGFEPPAYAYLLKHMAKKNAPFLTENENATLADGLWAIEPHIGKENFGVKFEEILVKRGSEIYWLDDSLPHV